MRYTMKFTCSRAIAQELTRHRVFSFAMESQRYCNYSKNKFGSEITFIRPSWFEDGADIYKREYDLLGAMTKSNFGYVGPKEDYLDMLCRAEDKYFRLLEKDLTPQQARDILPNATKTELCMTGFSSDWRRLLRLRLFEETGKVHPDMKVLMEKLKAECIKNEIWDDIINSDCKEI